MWRFQASLRAVYNNGSVYLTQGASERVSVGARLLLVSATGNPNIRQEEEVRFDTLAPIISPLPPFMSEEESDIFVHFSHFFSDVTDYCCLLLLYCKSVNKCIHICHTRDPIGQQLIIQVKWSAHCQQCIDWYWKQADKYFVVLGCLFFRCLWFGNADRCTKSLI